VPLTRGKSGEFVRGLFGFLERAAIIALFIVALAAIGAWLVFTPDPLRNCNYSDSLKSGTWTARPEARP
jgi:hypothetical protein